MKSITQILCDKGLCVSRSEARRLIVMKYIKINGEIITLDRQLEDADFTNNKIEVSCGKKTLLFDDIKGNPAEEL